MTVGQPKVLVAQSLPDSGLRFASLLRQAFPTGWVTISGSVRDAVAILERESIDIAVIDPRLPDGSGLHVVQRGFRSSPFTRSVITLACDDEIYLMEALAVGALGYLLEHQPDAVLIRQLQLLAEGIPPLAPPVAARLLHHFTSQPTQAERMVVMDAPELRAALTEVEQRVLKLSAAGTPVSAVANELEISTDNVCSHVRSIFLKRHFASRAQQALGFRYSSVA
jgi:DNA-binding NarL/FixJ family response regulator